MHYQRVDDILPPDSGLGRVTKPIPCNGLRCSLASMISSAYSEIHIKATCASPQRHIRIPDAESFAMHTAFHNAPGFISQLGSHSTASHKPVNGYPQTRQSDDPWVWSLIHFRPRIRSQPHEVVHAFPFALKSTWSAVSSYYSPNTIAVPP